MNASSPMPPLTGSSLDRTEWTFPADLEGPTLLMVAFRQAQQAQVNTWLPIARRLGQSNESFAYFEVPFIDVKWRPARGFIDGGMRAGIADAEVQATTVTVYGRRGPWLRRLGVDSLDDIVVLLVDGDGLVHWMTRGEAAPDAELDIQEVLHGISGR
ncbi:MAG: hypothetical protein HKN01_10025 [Acidimicrobiia bacterium]|nr:hypothetical protein [Acidimicrobiia bacterium]